MGRLQKRLYIFAALTSTEEKDEDNKEKKCEME